MAGGISTLGQSLDQIARLKSQQITLDSLSTQLATGKKTQKFSGLQSDVLRSVRARADVKSLQTYVDNLTTANRRLSLMSNSVEDIKKQATIVEHALDIAIQEGDYEDFEVIQDLARNALSFIKDAINTRDGNRYLFAGSDSSSKPINDTGLFDSWLGDFVPDESDLTNPPLIASGVIGQWGDGTITTDQFISAYHGVNETIVGYSSSLSNGTAGKVYIRADDNAEFDYTVLGNDPALKDIVTMLTTIIALPPVEFAPGALNDPTATTLPEDIAPFPPAEKQANFFQVINDLATTLNRSIDRLDDTGFRLGQVQSQIDTVKKSHTQDINALKSIIGEVEDVDLTEVASKINQLQVQLEVSYTVTGLIANLNLTRFI